MDRYDAIVVGSGPAGLEAAVNLTIRGKRIAVFGPRDLSAKLELAPRIDNYLGFPGISGADLKKRFEEHIRGMGIQIIHEQVSTVYPMGGYFAVASTLNAWETSAVILCTGVYSAKELPGEKEFLGRGVGYCATCDAPLYRGKTVVVLGYSGDAVEEANFVSEVAGKVYFFPAGGTAEGLSDEIDAVWDKPLRITGSLKAEALVTEQGELQADGFFILRDTIAPASLVPGLEVEGGFIKVDREMRTNLPGCFAAGDCTGKPHQYMKAAGEGQVAALNAAAFLDRLTK